MRVCYSPGYVISLPAGHRFPMGKYAALRAHLLAERVIQPADVVPVDEAPWESLRLVHTPAYLEAFAHGTLSAAECRRLGFPWSPLLVRRARLAVQGTLTAARLALEDGMAGNLAGGTHHAFPDRGEGFCALNDVAVAVRVLRMESQISRALVIDLDVHQGNGTAVALAGDPGAFTFSMHGARNYPLRKERSSLDVPLPDGTRDAEYLTALAAALSEATERSRPQIAFFLAGVDVVAGDRFGRLALTDAGLEAREKLVVEWIGACGIPLVIVPAGGYAPRLELTAARHAVAYRTAAAWRAARAPRAPAALTPPATRAAPRG